MTKPTELSLNELRRYTCKKKAATQFHGWHAISAPYVQNVADATIVKDRQYPFVGYSYWPILATVE